MSKDAPPPAHNVHPGQYADGHPLDRVHFLECKIILKPDRFTALQSFFDFGKIVAKVAKDADVGLSTAHLAGQKPQIREVVFFDTPDFRLYNNAFILRRRVAFEDGFPIGEPEIVFKFRHADLQKAAMVDVRPQIPGVYQVKFKAEALPLRDKIGGFRLLYSHNVEFGLSQVTEIDRASMATLSKLFPCLLHLKRNEEERVDLVNQTIVEEVLVDLGKLDFGKGVIAKTNTALWRTRGEHKPLVGEFSFQAKFDDADDLHAKSRVRCEKLFVSLQQVASEWVALGTTKTGMVYKIKGATSESHE